MACEPRRRSWGRRANRGGRSAREGRVEDRAGIEDLPVDRGVDDRRALHERAGNGGLVVGGARLRSLGRGRRAGKRRGKQRLQRPTNPRNLRARQTSVDVDDPREARFSPRRLLLPRDPCGGLRRASRRRELPSAADLRIPSTRGVRRL